MAFASQIVRFRWPLFAVAIALGIVAYPAASKVEMDRSLGALLAADDPDALAARRAADTLGEHPIVMLVYADDELASVDGVARNARLTAAVQQTPGVAGVLSPSVLESLVARMRPLGPRPALFQRGDKLARGFDSMFAGYTHSAEHRYAAVVAILDSSTPPVEQTVARLKSSLDDWQSIVPETSSLSLVGEPVLIEDAFDLIQRDGELMAAWILALLTAVILISLWDFRPAVVAVLVILFSVLVTRAMMTWMGIPLSLVSSILSAIVAIIAVTSTLHLGVATARYKQNGDAIPGQNESRHDAVIAGIAATAKPIFWTCATTAAGFAALTVSRIVPVAQFGWIVAIGAMLVPTGLVLIAPTMLCITPLGRKFDSRRERTRRDLSVIPLERFCRTIAFWAIDNRGKLAVASVVITMLAAAGLGRTEIESNFLKNFRDDSSIALAYDEVETKLGGAGVWDVILTVPSEIDRDTIDSIRDLQDKLRAIKINGQFALTKVLSLADADLVAKDAPLMRYVSPTTRLGVMQSAIPVFYQTLITESSDDSPRGFRIMLRSKEGAGTEQKQKTIAAVRRVIGEHRWPGEQQWPGETITAAGPPPYVTGYYVILTRLVSSVLADQYRCLAAGTALIALLLTIALGNLRRVAAALAINLIPIIWVLGSSGYFAGKLNMGAAMIAAVSIGLSIDGSVHYLLGLPPQRSDRDQSSEAASRTGVPIILATIALIVGFGTLTTSRFVPTSTFGGLLAWTLAAATIANLTLLPAAVSAKTNRA